MSVLDRVASLQPVQFRYRRELDPSGALRGGFLAQQVREVFPDAVIEADGVLMIDLDVLERYVAMARDELNSGAIRGTATSPRMTSKACSVQQGNDR